MDLNKFGITRDYIQVRSNTRPGVCLTSGTPVFFVAHDIGTGASSARNNRNYFHHQTDRSASAHVFVDDQEIIEIIPTGTSATVAEKAWHVIYNVTTDNERFGGDANDISLGVELCWGGRIDFKAAYARYVWYFAYLCTKFGKDPRKHIVGHFQLDPSRKTDPMTAFSVNDVTWERFIDDVASQMGDFQEEREEGNDILNITKQQQAMLINALTDLHKQGKLSDPTWISKTQNNALTVTELVWLNTIIAARK